MIYKKLTNIFLVFMMLFICLNLTREHWQNFFNYENQKENFYIKFHKNLEREIERINNSSLLDREFKNIRGSELEQREKSRWVFLKVLVITMEKIKYYSENQNFYPKEKVSLYLYSFFIGTVFFIIFYALYFILNTLNLKNQKNLVSKNNIEKKNPLIFLSFAYFIVITFINLSHFRGGEDNFSIFETLFLITGICFIISHDHYKKDYFLYLYILLCLCSPLIRESGILLSGFYLIYQFIFYRKISNLGLIIPLISIIPYCLVNYDIFKYYLIDGFILTTKSIEAQTTWHDLKGNFIGTMHAIFYNFIIFFIPLVIFFRKKNNLQNIFLLFIILYFLLLAAASVLDHVSTRFMPACLIIIYSYIGINNINFNNNSFK